MCVWVEDQDRALSFYTEKIGFEIRDDARIGNIRWVTVGHPEQQQLRLVLSQISALDPESAAAMRNMIVNGMINGGGLLSGDCAADYERLAAKGVDFVQAPTSRPYGVEAIFRDDTGNLWGIVQLAQRQDAPTA